MTGPADPELLSDVYRCPSKQARRVSTCPGVSISALRLNELITAVGLQLIEPHRLTPRRPRSQKRDELAERATQLRVGLQQIEADYYRGGFSDTDGKRRYLALRVEMTKELDALLKRVPAPEEPEYSGEMVWEFFDGQPNLFNQAGHSRSEAMLERFGVLTRIQQREVLAAGITSVHVKKFRGTQLGVPRSQRDVKSRVFIKPRDESFEGRLVPLSELEMELLWGFSDYEGPDASELMSDEDRAYLAHVLSSD
jgi:hypothetical protein